MALIGVLAKERFEWKDTSAHYWDQPC